MVFFRVFFLYLYRSLPTFLASLVFSFVLLRLIPGDPVMLMLGERGGSEETYQQLRAALGLDRSLWDQFVIYFFNVLQGNFGQSLLTRESVSREFFARLPATLELSSVALMLAVIIGIPLGVLCARYRSRWQDRFLSSLSVAGFSLPLFWWALLLIMFFSVSLGLTPVSGRLSPIYEINPVTGFYLIDAWFSSDPFSCFRSVVSHLLLPSFALATVPLASIVRMTRSAMIESLGQDYIRTARAKGLRERNVYYLHALRNALIPVVTTLGLIASSLITGAVLTETIFSWPGIGKWLIQSVLGRDYPVIQASIVFICVLVVLVNATVDGLYALIDPRQKAQN